MKVVILTLWFFMPREHGMLGVPMTRGWVSVANTDSVVLCNKAATNARVIMRKFPEFKAECLHGGKFPEGEMSLVIR